MPQYADPFDSFRPPEPEQAPLKWPEPIEYLDFEVLPVEKPKPIIHNLLDAASRMIFGGGSKTYKTWAMSDQALSIAAGAPWLGFDSHQCRVVYVNFELKEYYMQRRLRAIREAKNLSIARDQLLIWNLRSYAVTLLVFKTTLIRLIEKYGILVVFIDPFYQLLGERDERVSSELAPILGAFDEVNRITGASVICAAHFTKGNQAGKDALDRISGGASLNRHPDNLITLTKHEEEQAFSVEFTSRDFPPIEPFVVKWQYPLLVKTDLDPAKIKRPAHRPSTCDPEMLFTLIADNDDELQTAELVAKAIDQLGWAKRTVFVKLDWLKKRNRVFVSKLNDRWNVKNSKSNASSA
jgi:hypothetical protein